MALLWHNNPIPIPMVSLAVSAAALYARAVSSSVRPGFWRLAMLLPAGTFFVAVPMAFSSAILRCSAALFLAWLGTFKILLLAVDRGPLNPRLPVLHFLLAAALPVELVGGRRRPDKAELASASAPASIASCTFKVALVAAMALFTRFFDDRLHRYVRLGMYGVQVAFSIEVLFASIAAACSAALGVEVKPQFVRPHLATSLRDFWGRRWNLPVSAIMRASVYNPLRARAGKEVGILATFLVSGLMHEALLCYATLSRHPTGEMAAFFLLHGACRVAEEWCARRWPPPPRPLAMLLFHAFMMVTSLWLILPLLYWHGSKENRR